MEKLLKKRFVRTLLIVYVLSYIMHDFFFVNSANAESQITNTNLVAIIVDKNIYDDIKGSDVYGLQRYAKNYIQKKISDSKAIVLPINITGANAFKAPDIVKMLENMYFDGVKDKPSKLVGLVLIGDIPLPVVEYNTFIYPSIYPYVDFEDQQFVYNADKDFFAYNENPNGQAEIRHGIINFKDDIGKYENFFTKLQTYNSQQTDTNTGTQFVASKIRYDDFVATKENFLADSVTYYNNSFLFSEDVGYRRYTNILLDTLKGEHNNVVEGATNDLTSGLQNLIPENPDADEQAAGDFGAIIEKLRKLFKEKEQEMIDGGGDSTPEETDGPPPSTKSPTLTLQKMSNEFLKGYDSLLSTKYLTRMRDNVKTAARRYEADASGALNMSFDSSYNKIVQKDARVLGNAEAGLNPMLVDTNTQFEKALNEKIEQEKYYMHVPIPLTKLDYKGEKRIVVSSIIPPKVKKKCVWQKFDLWRNYYFGQDAINVLSAEQNSFYRGTFPDQVITTLSGVTSDKDTTRSVGSSYDVFSTQVQANKGYNFNAIKDDLTIYDQQKIQQIGNRGLQCHTYLLPLWFLAAEDNICIVTRIWEPSGSCTQNTGFTEGDECETLTGFAGRMRGGGSAINMDASTNDLSAFNYKNSRLSIYDIAGSKEITGAQRAANSYSGLAMYTNMVQEKFGMRDLQGGIGSFSELITSPENDGADLKFTNRFPEGNDKTHPTRVERAPLGYQAVDFFDKFVSPGNTQPDGGFGIYNGKIALYRKSPGICFGNGEIYTYKTLDSRVENVSPTPKQISSSTFLKFGAGSDLANFHEKMSNSLSGLQTNIESKIIELNTGTTDITGMLPNFQQIKTMIDNTNAGVSAILAYPITSLTQANKNLKAAERSGFILNNSKIQELSGRLLDAQEQTSDLLSYMSTINLSNAKQLFSNIIFSESLKKQNVELLDTWKSEFISSFNTIANRIGSLQGIFNTIRTTYNGTTGINNSTTSLIQNKRTAIAGLFTGQGCSTTNYKVVCDVLDELSSGLNSPEIVTLNAGLTGVNMVEVADQPPMDMMYNISALFTTTSNPVLSGISSLTTTMNTFAVSTDPSKKEVNKGMNMTTQDRPIDNIRNITFQGVGGTEVKFNYPNLYEVPVYNVSGIKLILKSPAEISQSIRNYLTGKVAEYNSGLQAQLNQKNAFYGANVGAFNFLYTYDILATPNNVNTTERPYGMIPEDFFIDIIGTGAIETLGKLMYYQNITWPEKLPNTGIVADINENKASFDVNKKISDIMNKYLSGENDQGPFITPTYSTGGYEVAFINSDSKDYIKAKPTPTAIQEIMSIQESKSSNRYKESPEPKDPIDEACKFDPSGSELIFDTKTLTSPWSIAFACRLKETLKNPFKITVDYGNAMGPTLKDFMGEINDSVTNRQGDMGEFASQRGALDTETSNQETMDNATTGEQIMLGDIITHTNMRLVSTGDNQPTSRRLGNQTEGKQIKIWSTRDLGNLDIKIQATGDNCLSISGIPDNLCKKYISNFNPSKSPKNFNVFFPANENKAGTTVVTVEFCIADTTKCIKKAAKIEIIADPLDKATIITPTNEVIAGGEVPITVIGEDQYGNQLGLTAPEVMLSTLSGEGQIRNGGTTSNELTFSDYKKTTLSYMAPREVPGDTTMPTTIYFSGLSKLSNGISITATKPMTVVKGFLGVYQNDVPTPLFNERSNNPTQVNPMTISLNGGEDIVNASGEITDNSKVPSIILRLWDEGGSLLTRVKSVALISTQNKLLLPGEIKDKKFINNGSYIISGGKLEIYLYPSFKAGTDTLYVSVPGIDPVRIPVTITPGTAKAVSITTDKETAAPGESVQAKMKVVDTRDNPIDQATTLKLTTIGALSIEGTDTLTVTGEVIVALKTKEPGGESYVYAKIDDPNATDLIPGYKDILVQNTLLPETGLNIMYLNLFGTDRGNQRGYFSNNNGYVNRLMNQSDKLLAITTQLMDPIKLRSTDVIVTQDGQIKNLAGQDISMQVYDEKFVVNIATIGSIDIGLTDSFELEQIEATGNMQAAINNKNIVLYIPEPTDSIIETNTVENKKILINGDKILNLNDGTIADGVTIILSANKIEGLSTRDVMMGEQKVGQLIISRKDTWILENAQINKNISNPEYDQKEMFAGSSTNGGKGIGFYQVNSSFSKEGYKSIEDNGDSTLGLGFTSKFKNVTYFSDGKSVGDSTVPFSSHFLINFGDPVLQKVSTNPMIRGTNFDGGLGEPIYSDPTKPIFKTIPIDFNDDGLQDIIIVHQDGTIKIMKNYGGNKPFSKLQDLAVIADSIKEVIVGDVDGNDYPDIMIWTNGNKLKVYKNNHGIFDVDGSLVCLNTNVKAGEINPTPDDVSRVSQIFFEDMNEDDKLDIITNDSRNDIKIFYGGSGSNGANYLSKLDYTCDTGRYDRQYEGQNGHVKLVKNFGITISTGMYVQDTSTIHRKGLVNTGEATETQDEGLDDSDGPPPTPAANESTLEGIPGTIESLINMFSPSPSAPGSTGGMGNMLSQRTAANRTREQPSPFDTPPAYEDGTGDIMYIAAKDLTTGDVIQIYKTYEDLNKDILEVGDTIKVTTTILPRIATQYTYLEDARGMGNSEIQSNEITNEFNSFQFAPGTNTGNIKINWDPGTENNDFMIETTHSNSDKIIFSYEMIYMGGESSTQIKIKDAEILSNDAQYHYKLEISNAGIVTTGVISAEAKDGIPDIVAYPNNACSKYSIIMRNTDQSIRQTYEDIFFNMQAQMDKKASDTQSATDESLADTMSNLLNTGTEIQDMQGMDALFENRSASSVFNASTQGGGISLNIDMGFIDDATQALQQKMDAALNAACAGFKLTEGKSCQGNPFAIFNQAFMAPGAYHIMGCLTTPLLPISTTLGQGIPLLTIPGNRPIVTPAGPTFLPAPGVLGFPFKGPTDSFFGAPPAVPVPPTAIPYSSMVRIYAIPTITLGLGIAICVGPQRAANTLPKPFRDMVGNCLVMALPPYTRCKDEGNLGGESDQQLPSFRVDDPRGSCSTPTAHGNTIVFQPETSTTTTQPTTNSPFIIGMNSQPGIQPDRGGNNFLGLIALDSKPIRVSNVPLTNQPGAATTLSATFNFGGGEKFTLEAGQKITLKQVASLSKGIVKCIVKDRVERQVLFLINNLTKMTVSVSFPDLSQLGEGRSSLSYENLKKILKDENAKDIANGNTKPLALSGAGFLTGAKQLFSKQTFQNISNQMSNPFDAIMLMFKEVPLINMNTKDINIKVPIIGSEDITKYIAYLKTRYETNKDIVEKWIELVNSVLAFCGRVSKEEAPKEIEDLNKELDAIMKSPDSTVSANNKNIYSGNIHKELRDLNDILALTGDTTWKKFGSDLRYLGNNMQLAVEKIKQIPRLDIQREWLETRKFGSGYLGFTFTANDEAFLKIVNTRLEKVSKCGDFIKGIGKFLKFYTDISGVIKAVKQNIRALEEYKKFPLKLYEWLHVVDRYLTEISSVFADFLGSIMYWMKTNADRFSKYVDTIILIIGVIKTWQILIDFAVNRSKKCGKCTNDDYSPQSCSLAFLCPKIPVLKIPNFKIPNLYIDLSHINLGIDITLPNFNIKPMSITLPKIPNLPNPPRIEILLEYDYGIDLNLSFFKELNLPEIPILPSPPQLPELPSFIPNVKITLPVLPPAPRVPKLSPKIELTIKVAEFIAKVYCIIKGGIGLVGEKGVKGKVEQLTQRTRHIPIFDDFDMTALRKEKPLKGFDFQLDAYLELRYNFDAFYAFLNAVVQPINNLSNKREGIAQKAVDEVQEDMNNNDMTDMFNDIENFQLEDLNSYVPEKEETLDYAAALVDIKKGIALFKNKADEQNDEQTVNTLKKIAEDIEIPTNIEPAYKELESTRDQVNSIINKKRQETQKLAEQIKNDYDGFINTIKNSSNTLVKDEGFSTSISAPLFKADQKTLAFLEKQENPNEEYIKANKTVIDGYVKALDSQTPDELNMSKTTYDKSKKYLQALNNKIEKTTPLIAYANQPSAEQISTIASTTNNSQPAITTTTNTTSNTIANTTNASTNPAPEMLIAQNTCTSCGGGGGGSAGAGGDSSSFDLSQFVKGIFVETYNSSGEKIMVNTVKSEENIGQIGKNYMMFDVNNDSTTNANEKTDIIMRDENTVYVKYASGDNEYGEDTNYYNGYYEYDNGNFISSPIINSPEQLRVDTKDNDGYIKIDNFRLKVADESREVKNFKMQGQDFESIKFGWMNSGLMGDKPDGYLIKLNQRVDNFNDKKETGLYGMDTDTLEEAVNKIYVLALPEGTDTGLYITLKDENFINERLSNLFSGTIIEIKFYDPTQEKINITLQEIPRTWQYAQIATLNQNTESALKTYEVTSTRSNQIVAGRQLIADTIGPEGEFELYRPQIGTGVGEGTDLNGFVSTHYTIKANRKDNVAVQAMRIEKDGEIIKFESGFNQTGYIDLPGLFYTGELTDSRFFGAQDFNGNATREQINLKIKIPEIEITSTNKINDESTEIVAEISNDLDEGYVLFQRERNSLRNVLTGANGNSYFPITGNQTVITGGIFSIGNTIGFYNIQGKEVGTLNPKNGRILINSGYQSTIKVQLDLTSHMPAIKIFDISSNNTLFQINLPTESLVNINMQQGLPKYEKTALEGTTFGIFNYGYCIKGQDDNCMIYVGPEGQVYLPTPYNNSLTGSYGFDTTNSNILYEIKDQSNNGIATISTKFKPQQ